MNSGFTDLYFIHKFQSLTNIVSDEYVQPRVYMFVQKSKSHMNSDQTQQDTINGSTLETHALFNSPKPICTREDSQRKPAECNESLEHTLRLFTISEFNTFRG